VDSAVEIHTDVACPFCGLACDDLTVETGAGNAAVRSKGCSRSIESYRRIALHKSARAAVAGQTVDLDLALAECARILRNAHRPAIGGLATDVAGVRAALALADQLGAAVDHVNGAGLSRNLLCVQDRGWITTTFSEVRNRADLVVIAGEKPMLAFPRLAERLLGKNRIGQNDREPTVISISSSAPDTSALDGPIEHLPCDVDQLGDLFAVLLGLLAGRCDSTTGFGPLSRATLGGLVERLRGARYGVLIWTADEFDFPHAELAIGAMNALLVALNETTRFAGLPLAGSDGDLTANFVCTWQTGLALPVSFAGGRVDYDPSRFRTEQMLERGEVDALVWISSLDPEREPPPTAVPTIVLGCGTMRLPAEPAVQIDVATPGVHHAGHWVRADGAVTVRLRGLLESELPSVAEVLSRVSAMI
jgi:formylmethanofuran dehydrogenase subunit B